MPNSKAGNKPDLFLRCFGTLSVNGTTHFGFLLLIGGPSELVTGVVSLETYLLDLLTAVTGLLTTRFLAKFHPV